MDKISCIFIILNILETFLEDTIFDDNESVEILQEYLKRNKSAFWRRLNAILNNLKF